MSFELKPGQSLRKGIRRIVRQQLEGALDLLTAKSKTSRDEVVHEVRKCFKKLRAVLRLARPAIGDKAYRRENICFRDAARPLTKVRDAKILSESLDCLLEHFHPHSNGRQFETVRKALEHNLRSVRKRVLEQQHAFTRTAKIIRQARARVKNWADVPNRWSAVGRGLKDTYRRACEAFRAAADDPTVENLHEWRKQTKYLRYQLKILRPLFPERLDELADEADRMGQQLGDDHDLAVLRQMLTAESDRSGDSGDREILLALADRRRADLEHETILLGQRFFQDSATEFTDRVKGYWRIWRSQAELQHADPELAPV